MIACYEFLICGLPRVFDTRDYHEFLIFNKCHNVKNFCSSRPQPLKGSYPIILCHNIKNPVTKINKSVGFYPFNYRLLSLTPRF